MKKQLLNLAATIALIHSVTVVAREIRAPLPFRNGFQRFEHYPYICENVDQCWDFDVWGGAYHRQAGDAFISGTKKQSLSGIYFGADSFTLAQTLPVGTVVPTEFNVLLTPRFNYSENGAMFGFNVNHRLECSCWDIGIRANIPFRAMNVTLADCCDLVASASGGDVIPGARCLINNSSPENVPGIAAIPATDAVPLSYAYRLDCLTNKTTVLNPYPAELAERQLVKFARVDGAGTHVAFDDKDADQINNYPVYVVAVPDGQEPQVPFARTLTEVALMPPLPGDGVIPAGTRAHFQLNTDYSALASDPAQQHRLWVVPTLTRDASGNDTNVISDDGANLRNFITPYIWNENRVNASAVTVSPIDFLRERGITFASQNLMGAGDFDLDFYAHRAFCDCCYGDWYVEGIVGVRFPTAKAQKNPGQLLAMQPLGNNRHFEIKLGAQVGIQPCDWFAVKADAQFYHAFPHTERVGAAFATATVQNIGTPVDAKISWNYFLGNVDFTFLVPCASSCVGFDLGYQPYYKGKDKVKFAQVTALDYFGNTQTLSASVLERNTNRLAHRVKSEIFHKNCTWEIFGGWLHTFAGKNIMRETDWYLGFGLFF